MMNEDLIIRHILVALDASPDSLAALEGAAALASKLRAELTGLFVEDSRLLEMADSPFAREILYPTARVSQLTRVDLEQRLRAQSDQARAALAEAAERARVPWVFRTARGNVSAELATAAESADLVCLGRLSWSWGRSARIGSTALQLANSAIAILLQSAPAAAEEPRLLVYLDNSLAGKRALMAARALSGTGVRVTILIAAADPSQARLLEKEASEAFQNTGAAVIFRPVGYPDGANVKNAIVQEQPSLLILGSRALFRDSLPEFLQNCSVPVLLLGDGAS